MGEDKPTLEAFKSEIASIFDDTLTEYMAHAVEDFWHHWSLFEALVSENDLSVHVDPSHPGQSFPDYRRYHWWTGAGTVSLLAGIILLWFAWKIGIGLICLGVGLHFYGSYVKFRDVRNFSRNLLTEATQSPTEGGFARLCANYMTGVVQLRSSRGAATWPQYSSNAVTGEETFLYQ